MAKMWTTILELGMLANHDDTQGVATVCLRGIQDAMSCCGQGWNRTEMLTALVRKLYDLSGMYLELARDTVSFVEDEIKRLENEICDEECDGFTLDWRYQGDELTEAVSASNCDYSLITETSTEWPPVYDMECEASFDWPEHSFEQQATSFIGYGISAIL